MVERVGKSVRRVGGGEGEGINVGYLRLGVLSSGEVLAKGCFGRGLVGKKGESPLFDALASGGARGSEARREL